MSIVLTRQTRSGIIMLVDTFLAHSSRGLGHLPLKEETRGSNPLCATADPSDEGFLF